MDSCQSFHLYVILTYYNSVLKIQINYTLIQIANYLISLLLSFVNITIHSLKFSINKFVTFY